jgi:ribosomal protein L34E
MKEEVGYLPGSADIVCHCCGNPLSWCEINQKNRELFYSYDGDYYKYSKSYKEYICDSCVRDIKINTILLSNNEK